MFINKIENKNNLGVEIITGIRPTGNLTIANYLGAVAPILELQEKGLSPMVFVADLHALTDSEPEVVKKYIFEVVADYIALGIDPTKTKIFIQSEIEKEISLLTIYLSRLISVSELLRVPTLKDKLKNNAKPETANALLLLYPVMMASDILIQRSKTVPVGEDQLAHLEVARELARRFNKKYGNVFPEPKPMIIKSLRVLSLKGEGKMSKSNPDGAIFLTDDKKTVIKKIKSAQTATEGEMSQQLESHILVAKNLAKTEEQRNEIDEIIKKHKKGEQVMGNFKNLLADIINSFLSDFQNKRADVIKDKQYILDILEEGKKQATDNATKTLELIKRSMYK